jgi:hypothetical protein|tara:strand:+ start:135 stop:644 length:510 start_codon:yes stop_codon:yes gene_type:complete
MKDWIAIVEWPERGKYADFNTRAEADAHVLAVVDRFPDAFAHKKPAGEETEHWIVDVGAKTVTFDQEQADTTKLAEVKETKQEAFIKEGVKRIGAVMPDWDTLLMIKFAVGAWPSLAADASASMILAKDIYLYVQDTATSAVNAMTTVEGVRAVDVTADTPLPGEPWPT